MAVTPLYVATQQGIYKSEDGDTFELLNSFLVHDQASGANPAAPAYVFTIGPGDLLYYVRSFMGNARVFSLTSAGVETNLSSNYPASAGVKQLLYDSVNDRLYGGFGSAAEKIAYWDGATWNHLTDEVTGQAYDTLDEEGLTEISPMIALLSDGTLFTSTYNTVDEAKIYRYNGSAWVLDLDVTTLVPIGFEDEDSITQMLAVGNELYVFLCDHTGGADKLIIKRSAAGSWSVVTPPSGLDSGFIQGGCVYKNELYVSYFEGEDPFRQEIYRRNENGTWTLEIDVLADNPTNSFVGIYSMFRWNDRLYAGPSFNSGDDYFLRRDVSGDWEHVVLNGGGYQFAGVGVETDNNLDISPASGDIRGGETVTITDTLGGFLEESLLQVRLGGEEASGVVATWVDENTITFVTLAHDLGVVDVLVLQDDTVYGAIEAGYTYTDDIFPHIDSIELDGNAGIVPDNGPITGGTAVTINGRNFVSGMSIYFDGLLATSIVFVDSTQYTCVTPAHTVGPVDVAIVEP